MLKWTSVLLALPLLGGCVAIDTVQSDVSTYSQWPTGRAPATYRFERLPSQQVPGGQQDQLEALAQSSVEAAGFKPAPAGATPNVTIQVMVRVSRSNLYAYDDPFWWRGGFYSARPGPNFSPYPHPYYRRSAAVYFESPRYVREAVVLVRDPALNQTLYEAHAVSEGNSPGTDVIVGALFKAAMVDFPHTGVNPRPVVITIAPAVAAASAAAPPADK
jgi:hypothetical protein